jgi:hypothetical protein
MAKRPFRTFRKALPEHAEQVKVIVWARWNEGRYPCLKWLHAIPNGGKRDVVVAIKLKAEGVKPGVSDLFLPYPVAPYAGLYVEMKAKDGSLSEAQADFLEYANSVGYAAAVCFGSDEAIKTIEDYLEGVLKPVAVAEIDNAIQ